jgi:hypothetical protein
MMPVETALGIGGEGMKESSRGVNSGMLYLIHCKNFFKYSNVPPPSTTVIIIMIIKEVRFQYQYSQCYAHFLTYSRGPNIICVMT